MTQSKEEETKKRVEKIMRILKEQEEFDSSKKNGGENI